MAGCARRRSARLPNIFNLDLGLAKTLKLRGGLALVLSADVFNILNSGTMVTRDATANYETLGKIYGVLNPRIVRFGLRLTF